jgi:hypothetical protein
MSQLRRAVVLAVLASASLSLLACSAGDDAPPAAAGAQASTALPLLVLCSGQYTCTDGSSEPAHVRVSRENDICMAGSASLEEDKGVTTDAGGHHKLGTWSGDSDAFDICADDGCLHCTNDSKPKSTGGAASPASTGSCTGSTYCSDYGPGDCGSHSGCTMHSHAVYSFGHFDHYENECTGSTPSCSSHDSASECTRQGCDWK